jgi:hypothetical protein
MRSAAFGIDKEDRHDGGYVIGHPLPGEVLVGFENGRRRS